MRASFHVVITSFTGQKFSKSLNATLEATVVFTDAKVPSPLDDPFCKDQNAYAQVRKTTAVTLYQEKTLKAPSKFTVYQNKHSLYAEDSI